MSELDKRQVTILKSNHGLGTSWSGVLLFAAGVFSVCTVSPSQPHTLGYGSPAAALGHRAGAFSRLAAVMHQGHLPPTAANKQTQAQKKGAAGLESC